MIIPLRINSDCNEITVTRKRLAIENRLRENANRIAREYNKNDKVLIVLSSFERGSQCKIGDPIVKGPYRIVRVNNNGTIRINRGSFEETISMRRVKPFKE